MQRIRNKLGCTRARLNAGTGITVLIGLIVTLVVSLLLFVAQRQAQQESFQRQANQWVSAWTAILQQRLSVLESLHALYESSDHVTQTEFHHFVEKSVLPHKGIKTVLWMRRLAPEQGKTRNTGESFPVLYAEPNSGDSRIVGYDPGSDSTWTPALARAAANAETVTMIAPDLPNLAATPEMCAVIQPIHEHETASHIGPVPRESLRGFLVGILDLGALAKSVAASLPPNRIDVELFDSRGPGARSLYRHGGGKRPESDPHGWLTQESPVRLANSEWDIRCVARSGFGDRKYLLLPLGTLAAGLLGTLATARRVKGHRDRYEEVKRLVADKTRSLEKSKAELKTRNEYLHHILASVTHPLYVIDAHDFTIRLSNQPIPEHEPLCYKVLHHRNTQCEADDCPIAKVRRTGKPCVVQHIHQDTDAGDIRYCQVHVYPALDDDGNVLDVIEYHLDVTDREIAQQQLAQQLEFSETLLETLPNPVYYKATDGKYLGCNKAFEEFVGYRREEIVGSTEFDIAPVAVAREHAEQDRRLLQSPGQQHREGQVETAAGVVRHVMFDKATFTGDGEVRGLIGVMSDITERIEIEQELRTKTDLLSHILANIPMFVFWKDRNSVYLGCNENFARSAGVGSPENIIGKTDYDLVWRDDADAYRRDDKRLMDSGEPLLAFEEPQTTASGGQITLLTSKVPLTDSSGAVVGILGVYTDITERKQAQEEIASLARFPQEDPCPVLRVTDDATIVYANPASESLLARFCAEVGDTLPARWSEPVKTASCHGTVQRLEIDCEDRTYSVTVAPVREAGYVNLYALDITGRKIAEQRQAELLREVEGSNRELRDFAHVASHDLKAPLRGIRTLADWMEADPHNRLSPESRNYLRLLAGRVDRMHRLINGILEYSQVARTRENRDNVDLNVSVAEVIDGLAPPEHIRVVVESELPVVWGEPTRLTQLFQNLISNAIKYLDKDQGLVKIGCSNTPDGWQFFVSDNGPGISEQHFDRIFQLFQTLAPKDSTESTGVGLTVAKKIVELHDGRLWLESKPGDGTTFFFTLPARTEEHGEVCTTAAAC